MSHRIQCGLATRRAVVSSISAPRRRNSGRRLLYRESGAEARGTQKDYAELHTALVEARRCTGVCVPRVWSSTATSKLPVRFSRSATCPVISSPLKRRAAA